MKAEKYFYYITVLAVSFSAAGLLFFQKDIGDAVRSALSLCSLSIIPSLFPFLVLSKLITNLIIFDKLEPISKKIMHPLFSLGHSCSPAFILGITAGYPVGAITAASLYRDGICGKCEAERLLSFSNNCGPAFIIAIIGYEIFGSTSTGLVLYLIHILSAVLCGFVFRIISPVKCNSQRNITYTPNQISGFSFAFSDAVSNALNSSLLICAYIVVFSAVLVLLQKMQIIQFFAKAFSVITKTDPRIIEAFLSGLLEVTKGSYMLSSVASPNLLFVLISTILGWGGFSVHAQTVGCLSDSGLSLKPYFIGKFLHGIFSFLLASTSLFFFHPKSIEVFSFQSATPHFDYGPLLAFTCTLLIYIFCKKGWKKAE